MKQKELLYIFELQQNKPNYLSQNRKFEKNAVKQM